MQSSTGRKWMPRGLILALGLAAAAPATAANVGWLLGGRVLRTDNAALSERQKRVDTVTSESVGLALEDQSARVNARLDGLYEYNQYARGTFSDYGGLTAYGKLDWAVIPNQMTWVVRDAYQQIPRSTREVVTPNTEQDTNGFVTGPDFIWNLGPTTFARAALRYGNYYFGKTDEDNSRYSASVGLGREVSPVTRVSINTNFEHVDFDHPTSVRTDYDSRSVFGRYDRVLPDGTFQTDLGYIDVPRKNRPDVSTGLFRASYSQHVSEYTTLGVEGSSGITDLSTVLVDPRGDPLGVDAGTATITGEVGRERRVAVLASRDTGTFSYGVTLAARTEDYDSNDLDRTVNDVGLRIGLHTTPRTRLFADVTGTRSRYTKINQEDSEYDTSLGLVHRPNPSLAIAFVLGHHRRTSDIPLSSYDENTISGSLLLTGGTVTPTLGTL